MIIHLSASAFSSAPQVLEIDASGWTGQISQTIRVKATENTRVAKVHIVIDDAQGNVFEQGEAVQAEGLWWTYTTTTTISMTPAPRLIATAQDLPGNSHGLVWQNN